MDNTGSNNAGDTVVSKVRAMENNFSGTHRSTNAATGKRVGN